MAFDPKFEAGYIRQFSGIVRHGTSSAVYSSWLERIRTALSAIRSSGAREQALTRLDQIGRYAFIHIEDPKGSSAGIADEIEQLAAYVESLKEESG